MKIQHSQSGKTGSFFIGDNGSRLALLEYKMYGDVLDIIHTEVDPSMQGRSIGYQLVEAAVIFARDNKLKIRPLCSFAKQVFDKEFKDVLEQA
ncbi:GNAT family N-acetyltransferase [Mucilaginibacter ginkgonis]|uniref:N-acetyltransferase n=1 Tax=Mucilaginibacter ginkgonis TaxID=2682091 RepID=A0A6I4I048_9SPHI|nr:GNAT family N-acetyltransferase [Mucilaginibacter ginkgonis]QQL50942.1 N-acetyltransferase [Mucilaginibacter ginkgonis]